MSHFNAGNVWGRITKAKEGKTEKKQTPFLDLEIDCNNPEYGNVKAFGRLWGKEKIAALQAALSMGAEEQGSKGDLSASSKAQAGKAPQRPSSPALSQLYRLKGFYGQYEEHGRRFSNYTFYDFVFDPFTQHSALSTQHFPYRAAFILVGDLTKKELDEDAEPKLYIDIDRPGKDASIEESFEVYLFDLQTYDEVDAGDLIEVRGLLRKREAEDEYGGTTDNVIRPYVMVTKKRVRK